jgi:hypothetical protein
MNSKNKRSLNNECENAMIDKPFHEEIKTWIEDYQSLFLKTSLFIKENDLMDKFAELKNNNDSTFILKFYKMFLEHSIK